MLSLVLITALAQPIPSALSRASHEATALVEVELPLITTERADLRWQRALQQPKVKAMLASRAPMDAPESIEITPFEVIRSNPLQPMPLPQVSFGLGLTESFGWVGADQSQRKTLQSDNVYLRRLAAEFLVPHGASGVVDAAWGAPGSEARTKNEATARVAPDCKG